MQRTLDVILTTANFKSVRVTKAKKKEKKEMNTVRKIVRYEPKRSSRASKFLQLEVVSKEESFNGITERKSRESRVKQRQKYVRMRFQSAIRWMDGWIDRLTTRYDVEVYCVQKSKA